MSIENDNNFIDQIRLQEPLIYPEMEIDDEMRFFEQEMNQLNQNQQIIEQQKDQVEPEDNKPILGKQEKRKLLSISDARHPHSTVSHLPLQTSQTTTHPISTPTPKVIDLKDLLPDSLDVFVDQQGPRQLEAEEQSEKQKKTKPQTFFAEKPPNNQRVFINLHWTRYEIVKRVCQEEPHQFKTSMVEPQGEESETDSEGVRKVEHVENKEFLDQDIVWFDSYYTPDKFSLLKNQQKINHFPGMQLLTRKNYLAKQLIKMRKLFGKEIQGQFPKTYLMPYELKDLKNDMLKQQKLNKRQQYIIKPEASSQGKGIALVKHWSEIDCAEEQKWVCQKQVMKPFLIDGLKFDIRLYVLVTSIDPLRVFLHKDGFLRFCTTKQEEPTNANQSNLCMHLTNQAINRFSKNFVHNNSDNIKEGVGSKRHIEWFKDQLSAHGFDQHKIFGEIEKIIVKTLLSVQQSLTHQQKSCQPNDHAANMCFEILGFDIMFNHKMKPLLLEVNHAPSFNTDSVLDERIKYNMLSDTFKILYMVGPRAKRAYYKFKQQETNKKIIGKHKWSKEEKEELSRRELEKKDQQALDNLNGYKRIHPSEDAEMQKHYVHVQETIRDMNNLYMRKKPKKDEDKRGDKAKPRSDPTSKGTLEPDGERKPARTKEEIQSIVDRLYYSRLNRAKVIKENFRQAVLKPEQIDKPFVYLNTPIIDLNFNFSNANVFDPFAFEENKENEIVFVNKNQNNIPTHKYVMPSNMLSSDKNNYNENTNFNNNVNNKRVVIKDNRDVEKEKDREKEKEKERNKKRSVSIGDRSVQTSHAKENQGERDEIQHNQLKKIGGFSSEKPRLTKNSSLKKVLMIMDNGKENMMMDLCVNGTGAQMNKSYLGSRGLILQKN